MALILSLTNFMLTSCTHTVISVEQVKKMIQDQAPISDGVLTFDDLVIQFYIDKDGRMIDYTVKMVGSE